MQIHGENDKSLADKEITYEQLFKDNYVPMIMYAVKVLKNKQEAEDIVQNIFKKIIEKGNSLLLGSKASHLLFSALHNAVIDYVRKQQRHTNLDLKDTPSDYSIEQTILEIEIYQQLYNAVKHLPQRNRKVLQMKLNGMSDKEIADALNLSIETVRSHVKHAVQSLRSKISHSYIIVLMSFLAS